jgi:plasmid stabilization system protein ParE
VRRYRLSIPAKADIDGIWLDVAKTSKSIAAAERLIWRIHGKIAALAQNPRSGRLCIEIDADGRCSHVLNYIIYYRIGAGHILVTRVIHAKRDQSGAWKQNRLRDKP